jgi:Cys-tRNA(Pro)/Cys-tRNA(Cys) deacylase
MSAKRAEMADKIEVQKVTGYMLGGVSPIGQKRLLPTVIDSSAELLPTLYVSAGKRGLEVELAPNDLANVIKANFYSITT